MSILIVCLLIAMLMPLMTKIPLAIAMHRQGGYDNKNPRAQQRNLKGFGARALASHQNSFESLIWFSAATATALATNHFSDMVTNLAIMHVFARLGYHTLYLLDWDKLRSFFWGIGFFCSIAIVWQCLP